jgi:hypothetical protein
LERDQQYEWLGIFLRKLMHLPRNIWKPTLITIDEMHRFAPEQGQAEKKNESQQEVRRQIKELFSAGGKRGYAGICATQRWAKVDKSAIAEIQNYLVGKTFYPEDIERAAKAMGIPTRKEVFEPFSEKIRHFGKGQFYAFGSALSEILVEVQINKAQTPHPERGKPQPVPPPTPENIKALLPKLAAIPKEMEKEEHERGEALRIITERHEQIQALNSTIRELREQLSIAHSNISADKADHIAQFTRQEMLATLAPFLEAIGNGLNRLVNAVDGVAGQIDEIKSAAEALRDPIEGATNALMTMDLALPAHVSLSPLPAVAQPMRTETARRRDPQPNSTPAEDKEPGSGPRKVLAMAARFPEGVEMKRLRTLAGVGSIRTMQEYARQVVAAGYASRDGGKLRATREGIRWLGADLQSGPQNTSDVMALWNAQLGAGPREILRTVVGHRGAKVPRSSLGISSKRTEQEYIRQLKAAGLVAMDSNYVWANKEALFL